MAFPEGDIGEKDVETSRGSQQPRSQVRKRKRLFITHTLTYVCIGGREVEKINIVRIFPLTIKNCMS